MQVNHLISRDRDEWQPCPPGELQRMVQRIDAERHTARRTTILRAAAAMGIVLVVGVAVVWRILPPEGAGGLTCAECQAEFGALYRHVDLGEEALTPERMAAVLTHLENCEYCGERFRELYPQSNVLLKLDQRRADHSQRDLAMARALRIPPAMAANFSSRLVLND